MHKYFLDYSLLAFAMVTTLIHRISAFFFRAEDVAWLGLAATIIFYLVLAIEIAIILDRTQRNNDKIEQLEQQLQDAHTPQPPR